METNFKDPIELKLHLLDKYGISEEPKTMEAKELMIGDWVLYNPNVFIEDEYEPPKPCYPTKIDSGEDLDLAIEDCYAPIPLTSEILEKNGLEKEAHRYGIYDDYYDFEMYEYNDGTWLVSYHCCEMQLQNEQLLICYVHQLQHFMRHCGIEKEIVL